MEALLAVLDPEIVLRVDATAVPQGAPRELRARPRWLRGRLPSRRAHDSLSSPGERNDRCDHGAAWRLFGVGVLTIHGDRILEMELVADPDRLRRLELAVLED